MKLDLEGGVARGVGRHRRRAEQGLALAVAGGSAGGIGEELERVGRVGALVERALDLGADAAAESAAAWRTG